MGYLEHILPLSLYLSCRCTPYITTWRALHKRMEGAPTVKGHYIKAHCLNAEKRPVFVGCLHKSADKKQKKMKLGPLFCSCFYTQIDTCSFLYSWFSIKKGEIVHKGSCISQIIIKKTVKWFIFWARAILLNDGHKCSNNRTYLTQLTSGRILRKKKYKFTNVNNFHFSILYYKCIWCFLFKKKRQNVSYKIAVSFWVVF